MFLSGPRETVLYRRFAREASWDSISTAACEPQPESVSHCPSAEGGAPMSAGNTGCLHVNSELTAETGCKHGIAVALPRPYLKCSLNVVATQWLDEGFEPEVRVLGQEVLDSPQVFPLEE